MESKKKIEKLVFFWRDKVDGFCQKFFHGFGKNLKFFHVFIFGKINRQNVFDVILESQKAILDYKKQKNKKVKKSGFFRRG